MYVMRRMYCILQHFLFYLEILPDDNFFARHEQVAL